MSIYVKNERYLIRKEIDSLRYADYTILLLVNCGNFVKIIYE